MIEELRHRAWQERAAASIGRTNKQKTAEAENAARQLEIFADHLEGIIPELTYEQVKAKQDAERLMYQWWTLLSEQERQDAVKGIVGCLQFGLTRNVTQMPETGKLAVELAYARHLEHVAELERLHPAD